jgi:hypothetical protein
MNNAKNKKIFKQYQNKKATKFFRGFLVLYFFIVAASSPSPLIVELNLISKNLRCIEKALPIETANSELLPLSDSSSQSLIFKNKNLQDVVTRLKKIKSQIEKLSVDMSLSNKTYEYNLTEFNQAVEKYLELYNRIAVIYAYGAHQTVKKNFNVTTNFLFKMPYSFSALQSLNLNLNKTTSLNILEQYPYNAYHKDENTLSFDLSKQDLVFAEAASLSDPKDVNDYKKLLTFSVLKDGFVNRWALRKYSVKKIQPESVTSCGQEFLSFERQSTTIESSYLYQELENTDQYNKIQEIISKLSNLDDSTIGSSQDYFQILKSIFENNQENIKKLKKFLIENPQFGNQENEFYTKVANDFFIVNEQNVVHQEIKILDNYSVERGTLQLKNAYLPRDRFSPQELSKRLAENMFALRKQALQLTILDIAQAINLNQELVEKNFLENLSLLKNNYINRLSKIYLDKINEYLQEQNYTKNALKYKQEKINETLNAAKTSIQSAFELNLIKYRISKKIELPTYAQDFTFENSNTKKRFQVLTSAPQNIDELKTYYEIALRDKFNNLDNPKEVNFWVNKFFDYTNNYYESLKSNNENALYISASLAANRILNEAYEEYKKNFGYYNPNQYEIQKKQYEFSRRDKTQIAPKLIPVVTKVNEDILKQKSTELSLWEENEKNERVHDQYCLDNSLFSPFSYYSILSKRKENRPKLQSYVVTHETIFGDNKPPKKPWIEELVLALSIMHVEKYFNFEKPTTLSQSEIKGTNQNLVAYTLDHLYLAQARLGLSLAQSAILSKPWVYHLDKKTYWGQSWSDDFIKEWENEPKPSLLHLGFAWNPVLQTIDTTKAKKIISDFIDSFNQNDSLKFFCEAYPFGKNYYGETTENFRKLFKASSNVRAAIDPYGKYKKFEESVRLETRTTSEWWLEEFVYSWGVTILFMAVFLLPVLLAPLMAASATLATILTGLMTWVNIVSGPFFISGMIARWNINFIEKPAQLKFQGSLIASYAGYDIKTMLGKLEPIVNEENYNAEKMQLKMEQWLEPIYSALDIWASSAALNDFKRITGTTLKKSASKLGLEARGFGRPPETVKIVQSFSSKKEEQGLFKAITSTLNEKISSLARFSANYQNFSKEDVILALRKKLSENLKNDHSKYIPELQDALNYQLKRYEKSIESMNNSQNPMKDLILRDKSIPEEYIPDALLYSGQVLSFVQSPTLYEIGLWPKALITAIYKKDIKMLSQFLKNYGEHMRLMRKLRTYHIKNKIKQYAVLIKKFQISSKNKLSNSELIANLTDEELSLLYEASKLYDWLGNANIDKKILQHIPFTKGPLRELRPWFEAHENIVSALKPLHPNLRKLSQEEMKNYEPTHYYDEATDTYVSKDDLKAWYRFMQENDWTQNPDKNIKRLNDGFDETFLGK